MPVWLRVDALDGFFQFTEFATQDWPERVDHVAANIREDLAGASHLAGVILSSGSAVALGATNSTAENQTTRSTIGCGLRRLISAHTVREMVVVALRDDVADQQERWTAAYAAESEWFPQDLFSDKGLPELSPSWVDGRQSRSRSAQDDRPTWGRVERPVPRPLLGRR